MTGGTTRVEEADRAWAEQVAHEQREARPVRRAVVLLEWGDRGDITVSHAPCTASLAGVVRAAGPLVSETPNTTEVVQQKLRELVYEYAYGERSR